MNTLAVVPCRGGSKTIPNKNLAVVAGKPLLWWTLEAAAGSDVIDLIVVSSDSDEILDSARECADSFGNETSRAFIKILKRPPELAQDDSSTEDVIDHAIKSIETEYEYTADTIVLLQPTSPIRTPLQIDGALLKLTDRNFDSVLSVVESHAFVWQQTQEDVFYPNYEISQRPRRQDFKQYEENGSIYAFTKQVWNKDRNRIGGRIGFVVQPEECRLQIDTPLDLYLVEKILERTGRRVLVSVN